MEDNKQVVTGSISNYVFESNDSLYKVCQIITKDDKKLTIVGSFPHLEDGLNYEFVGTMKNHPKYGEQLVVESYRKSDSFTEEGLIQYLSSEKFKGIGPKLASNIVEELGLDCIKIILQNPDELNKVYGLTKGKKEILVATIKDNYASEQVYIRLYGFGLTSKMVYRLIDTYGLSAANKIEENPYCLINEVEGFGFKRSDNLALSLGFKEDDLRRIKAAVVYTLNYVCYQQGFTFLTKDQLINSAKNLLCNNPHIDSTVYEDAILDLTNNHDLIVENERYFEPLLYKSEVKLATKINKLRENTKPQFTEEKAKKLLVEVERDSEVTYTPLQKEAILSAVTNKLSIITGGPGTGKSTILNGILRLYAYLNGFTLASDELTFKVCMVAPTGRAAKRMTETTNFKATTIHKALGYNYEGGFNFSENCLLSYSLLIVDEASMLDINLAASLFSALPNTASVILVGDSNQLPSVGPGNVLYDLIESNVFKTTRLTQIMRQAKDSDIISLSQMVLNEQIQYNIFSHRNEIFFYDCEAKNLIALLYKFLDKFIETGGDLQQGIQVLIPMYAGVAGIDAVNKAIQDRYNKEDAKLIKRDERLFKKNDKVLQLKNDPELNIMNGDVGKVLDVVTVDDKEALLIDFDGKVVTYFASNIDNLTLAYAMSIHKAQGSEFDNIILPIFPSYQIMLKKKLIYTGITRAKKKLIVIGKLPSLEMAIHNQDYLRQTALVNRISLVKEQDITKKIFDPLIPFDTLGEYDMEGITPYTFMKN